MAYELIETVTVGSGGASSIEFTSIPQDGTDLVCVVSARSALSGTQSNFGLRMNGVSTNTYDTLFLRGTPGTVATNSFTTNRIDLANVPGSTSTSNTFGNISFYISNYTSSNQKSVSADTTSENDSGTANQAFLSIRAGLNQSTSAITSIELFDSNGQNLLQYSTASLYKITAA